MSEESPFGAEVYHHVCATCLLGDPVCSEIRRWLKYIATGKPSIGIRSMIEDYLKPKYGYTLSRSSLHRHIRKCEPKLHELVKRTNPSWMNQPYETRLTARDADKSPTEE